MRRHPCRTETGESAGMQDTAEHCGYVVGPQGQGSVSGAVLQDTAEKR